MNLKHIIHELKTVKSSVDHIMKWQEYIDEIGTDYNNLKELFGDVGDDVAKPYFKGFMGKTSYHPLAAAIGMTQGVNHFFKDMPIEDKNHWFKVFEPLLKTENFDYISTYAFVCFKNHMDISEYEIYLDSKKLLFEIEGVSAIVSHEILHLLREDFSDMFHLENNRKTRVPTKIYFWIYIAYKLYESADSVLEVFETALYDFCNDKEYVLSPIKDYLNYGTRHWLFDFWDDERNNNLTDFLRIIKEDPKYNLYFRLCDTDEEEGK